MGRGRKALWNELNMPDKLEAVEGWAKEGSLDKEIIEMLGISHDTFYNWKKDYPEFSEALKKGRYISNGELLNAAFKTATGYTETEKQLVKLKDIKYRNGKPYQVERIEIVDLEKKIAPNTTALIFMLKNRIPEKYRDKKELEVNHNKLEDYFTNDKLRESETELYEDDD